MDTRDFFRLLSLLLDYPDEEVYTFVVENEPPTTGVDTVDRELAKFWEFYRSKTLNELREYYVANLDFGKKTNLYITYHRYGDNRKRGGALASLKEIYQESGFDIGSNELPDYLPVVLEFAALGDFERALKILEDYSAELQKMKKHFSEAGNPYGHLLVALDEYLKTLKVQK